jgi:hypothetical protein
VRSRQRPISRWTSGRFFRFRRSSDETALFLLPGRDRGGPIAGAPGRPARSWWTPRSFYHEIPAGDNIGGAGANSAGWLFNNSILNLGSKEDAVAKIAVSEPGAYRLFVRAQGSPGSGFRVSIDGKLADGTFGVGPIVWTPSNSFDLKKGSVDIRLTSITPRVLHQHRHSVNS